MYEKHTNEISTLRMVDLWLVKFMMTTTTFYGYHLDLSFQLATFRIGIRFSDLT